MTPKDLGSPDGSVVKHDASTATNGGADTATFSLEGKTCDDKDCNEPARHVVTWMGMPLGWVCLTHANELEAGGMERVA